ncbi:hypothetical protein BpHYR1_039003 [Brachionus plicatilis]|uniref:Uncharacterized protein n=1 Tax=Brachionus plicatilis TaxID=10195 RepID=A0A3M7SGA1_BRAPC|nr:hypothetical protein BpHYR1_039003 [Brachionus plicatilis]
MRKCSKSLGYVFQTEGFCDGQDLILNKIYKIFNEIAHVNNVLNINMSRHLEYLYLELKIKIKFKNEFQILKFQIIERDIKIKFCMKYNKITDCI